MTVSNRNLGEVKGYCKKWHQVADDVLLQPTHYCKSAFNTGTDQEAFLLDPETLARQLDGTPLKRDGYIKSLITSLKKEGTCPRQRCYAGILMVRLDPWGNVYPCLEQHVRVGQCESKISAQSGIQIALTAPVKRSQEIRIAGVGTTTRPSSVITR